MVEDSDVIHVIDAERGIEVLNVPHGFAMPTERIQALRDKACELLAEREGVPGREEISNALQRFITEANEQISLDTADTPEDALRIAGEIVDRL